MKEAKRRGPRKPAAPVSRHDPVRSLERPARQLYHVQKILLSDGDEAAIEALRNLVPPGHNYDPSDASMAAFASVALLDSSFTRDESTQAGRSQGGKGRGRQRRDVAAADYETIREKATQLLGAGSRAPRDVPGIISRQTGFSVPKIYRALATHFSGHWKRD